MMMASWGPLWVPRGGAATPTSFPSSLVFFDGGYTAAVESNKLVFLNSDELAITERAQVRAIDASVRMATQTAIQGPPIAYDWANDNVLVVSPTAPLRICSFDPRTCTMNWATTLDVAVTFLGTSSNMQSPCTQSLVWVQNGFSPLRLRAFNLLTGALVYDFNITSSTPVVGGSINRNFTGLHYCAVSDTALMINTSFINAENGGAVAPYQAFRLRPLTSTTFQVEARTGIPGVVGQFVPSGIGIRPQRLGLPADTVFIPFNPSVVGQVSLGALNIETGAFTPVLTAPGTDTWFASTMMQFNDDMSRLYVTANYSINGVSRGICMQEHDYPSGTHLGTYGSQVATTGNHSALNNTSFNGYRLVGNEVWGFVNAGISTWPVGRYTIEARRNLPLSETTMQEASDTGTPAILPKSLYHPRFPSLSGQPDQQSSWLTLPATSKVVSGPVPSLVTPASPVVLNSPGATVVTLSQRITWCTFDFDGLYPLEISLMNNGTGDTIRAWVYDSAGRQVTFNPTVTAQYPIMLRDRPSAAGTYYLAVLNQRGDSQSIVTPDSEFFRITVSNSPAVVPHDITLRIMRDTK